LVDLDEEVIRPVPEEYIDLLPVSTFTIANKENFSDENKLCTICQEHYEVGESYLVLPCMHKFHKACISQWFKTKDTCPICKANVIEGQEEEVAESSEFGEEEISGPFMQNEYSRRRAPPEMSLMEREAPNLVSAYLGEMDEEDSFAEV
jgi:hypothetical protein